MSALVLDAGAFVAAERDDRVLIARLRAAQRHGVELRSNAIVVAQVWRDPQGARRGWRDCFGASMSARSMTGRDARPGY
ncbi:MAG TPA: hypothetical protein VGO16_15890 [Pseudonocardiaceae bacterium]|nr:hypothetical protein [Pseudonocardiaceae bacterium]